MTPAPGPPPLSRTDWGLILVLAAVQFTHMVDFVIVMPLGGRLMNEFGVGPGAFGWVVSVYAWAAGLAGLLAGPVIDRFDRRTVLLTLYAGFAVSTLACGLAPTYELLLATRAAAGVCGGLAVIAILSVIADVFPSEKQGRATGAVISAFGVASIAGLPAGLALADRFGRAAPFAALAAVSAGVWVVAWAKLPAVRGHLGGIRRHPVAAFVGVVREPAHLRAFAFSFVTVMSTGTIGPFVGPYLAATNGWGESELAVIYMAAGACTLVGMNVVGRLADRVARRPLFRWLAAAAAVMAVVVTNLPPTGLAAAAVALSLFMVFSAGRVVPAQALLFGVAAPHARGTFVSLETAVRHLATGVAPVVAGALLTLTPDGQLTGYPAVGLVAAGTAAVSLVLVGLVRPAPA